MIKISLIKVDKEKCFRKLVRLRENASNVIIIFDKNLRDAKSINKYSNN